MRPDLHLVSITDRGGGAEDLFLGVYWDVGGEAVERNQTRAEAVTGPFSAEPMRLDEKQPNCTDMKESLLLLPGHWLLCQTAASQGGASTAASDWWRRHFWHFAGATHHLSPDCAVLLRSSTPGPHSDLLFKSQSQPYPRVPPMWKSALSLWGSAFWITVNSKRAAGTIWNAPYTKQRWGVKSSSNDFIKEETVIAVCFIWCANYCVPPLFYVVI